MTGAGNDFLVIGPRAARAIADRAAWVRKVCARGLSIGADGVVFVEADGPDRVRVQFVNPDGSSSFCGNGSRCAARFARLEGLVGDSLTLLTESGDIPARIDGDDVRLMLPPPIVHGEREASSGDTTHRGLFVTAMIPHFVVFVDDPHEAPLSRWGPALRRHPVFGPQGTNVNLASQGDDGVVLRTWERGVEAETLCCGSGAVAVAAAARLRGAPPCITLRPAGGIPLRVELPGDRHAPECAILSGEARVLFRGEIDPEAWEWPG
jgi:diaminopimelate epimerase